MGVLGTQRHWQSARTGIGKTETQLSWLQGLARHAAGVTSDSPELGTTGQREGGVWQLVDLQVCVGGRCVRSLLSVNIQSHLPTDIELEQTMGSGRVVSAETSSPDHIQPKGEI